MPTNVGQVMRAGGRATTWGNLNDANISPIQLQTSLWSRASPQAAIAMTGVASTALVGALVWALRRRRDGHVALGDGGDE